MSHLHFPDGVISPQWWIGGYLLAFAILFLSFKRMNKDEIRSRIPFVGVLAAIMLITMSVPLGFIPFHLSLAVLCGILAGPALGFTAVFVVNLFMALMGHGGITMVGLNTLIIGSEVAIGYGLFRLLSPRIRPVPGAAVAVCCALLVSTLLMLGVTGIAAGQAGAVPHAYHAGAVDKAFEAAHEEAGLFEEIEDTSFLIFTGWGAVLSVLVLGIGLEALVTALIVRFFLKVRPDLVKSVS